jgi:hypothetical protein
MAEAAAYFVTIALFSFVILGSALMQHDMLLLACIPPVFVAAIMGFVMALYAGDSFGWLPTIASALIGCIPAWYVSRRFKSRDLLLFIYLGWAIALILALISFGFPDRSA